MTEQFTHNIRYTFTRWSDYWCSKNAYYQADLYREMESLTQEGIPEEAMKIVSYDFDRSGGFRYHRLAIDFSADEQIAALAERIHQAWLAQKAIDDERYAKQREAAMQNQQAQGMDTMECAF